jgi:hypothetical protein
MSVTTFGTRVVGFLRTDYPEGLPRNGFVAAVALLPQRALDGAHDSINAASVVSE